MGRHRRSDAGRAATGRATGTQGPTRVPQGPGEARRVSMGTAPYLLPEAYADDPYARSDAFLFGAEGSHESGFRSGGADRHGGVNRRGGSDRLGAPAAGASHRREDKPTHPVRTGLLGVSAAVALGAVAVATGVLPGGGYGLGGGNGDGVRAGDSPNAFQTSEQGPQGGTSGPATEERSSTPASRGGERAGATPSIRPSRTPSASASKQSTPARPKPAPASSAPSTAPSRTTSAPAAPAPEPTAQETTSTPTTVSAQAAAEAQVLKLVNQERATAGCHPVTASSSLTKLAESFSTDMAEKGFFDHTDPDGNTPWDRADAAGISNLGGENIARGQADAQAVMDAWMDSPGHRANILNCDFTTLGVGVHFGGGGPWWTQDFGY